MGKKKKQEKAKKSKEKEKKVRKTAEAVPEKASKAIGKATPKAAPKATSEAIPETKPKRKPGAAAGREKLSSQSDQKAVAAFRALGDENRMQIVRLLVQEELCAGELLQSLHIVQSTLSHHMKILTESGVVQCKRQGKRAYYSIDKEVLKMLESYIGLLGQQESS